jgi:hypothetical protein
MSRGTQSLVPVASTSHHSTGVAPAVRQRRDPPNGSICRWFAPLGENSACGAEAPSVRPRRAAQLPVQRGCEHAISTPDTLTF